MGYLTFYSICPYLGCDSYVVFRNKRVFIPPILMLKACISRNKAAIIKSLMNIPSSQVMHQTRSENLMLNVSLGVLFVMYLSGLCWALQMNFKYDSGWEKQYSAAGRQMSGEQSPSTITFGHLGPVSSQRLFFFLFSSMSPCIRCCFSFLSFLSPMLMSAFILLSAPHCCAPCMYQHTHFSLCSTILVHFWSNS